METNHLDKQNFFDLGNLDSLRRDALNSGDASTDASKAALKKRRHNLKLSSPKCY